MIRRFLLFLFIWGMLGIAQAGNFNLASKDNVVVYWGQGPDQPDLLHFCEQPNIDIIVLSFVHLFPAQANGFLGTNFGNKCNDDVFPGPGFGGQDLPQRNALQADCPTLKAQVPICQETHGKKILLSLGGGVLSYQLTGTSEAEMMADQLWQMFGPLNETAVAQGMPRPFDSDDQVVEVDGFDMDIELAPTDGSVGYDHLVTRLRVFFETADRPYYLTGSPQCIVPDASMGSMISAAKFDMLFIQFYNTPQCSAATWARASMGNTASWIAQTPSKNAKLYISLPGAPQAANPDSYISHQQAGRLIDVFRCRPQFGGIAVWEATLSDKNRHDGYTFSGYMKKNLVEAARKQGQYCQKYSAYPSVLSTSPYYPSTADGDWSSSVQSTQMSQPTQTYSTISDPAPSIDPYAQSDDTHCGPEKGVCPAGQCCSQYNYCGVTPEHCEAGCQSSFGTCGDPISVSPGDISAAPTASSSPGDTDARCGEGFGDCYGASGGPCCSQYGYCGGTPEHCGEGCQILSGTCG